MMMMMMMMMMCVRGGDVKWIEGMIVRQRLGMRDERMGRGD